MSNYKNMVFIIPILVIIAIVVLILVLKSNNSKNKEKFDSSIIVSSKFKRGGDNSNFTREKICPPCPPCPPCPNNNCKCNNCKCNNCNCNDDSSQYQKSLVKNVFYSNRFVAVGKYIIAWSDDGYNWTDSKIVDGFYEGLCLAYNGTVWVAGCNGTDIGSSIIFSENNAKHWTTIKSDGYMKNPPKAPIHGVAWNGTFFVAVGESFDGKSRAAYSPDGKNWQCATGTPVETSTFDSDNRLIAIACNKKICLTISAIGFNKDNFISYSMDNGITWKYGTGAKFTPSVIGAPTSIAINDNNICVSIAAYISNTNILISSDGIHWNTPNTNIFNDSNSALYCVEHDNASSWVVVGNKGIGYSSNNGQTWNFAKGDFTTYSFSSVVYNGKIWVASGGDFIVYSTDGIIWTNSKAIGGGNHLCWNGAYWVCESSLVFGSILRSEDGKIWNTTSDICTNECTINSIVS
jgi:hypothetical protein